MWELFNEGRLPYRAFTNEETVEKVISGYRLTKPDHLDADIYDTIMMPCWHQDPLKRADFAHLLRDIISLISKRKPNSEDINNMKSDKVQEVANNEYAMTYITVNQVDKAVPLYN